MSQQSKKHLLGRTSIVAISTIAVLVGGGILAFNLKAEAQSATRHTVVTFAPALMAPRGAINGGTDNLLIGLLLPAVQRNGTPAVLEAFTGDGSVRIPLQPSPQPDRQGTAFVDVFLTANQDGNGGMLLHMVDEDTGVDTTAPTTRSDVTVRLLPAVQDGLLLPAVSVAETISGNRNVTITDGTVIAVPFQYALPAVQLPAVQ